MGIVNSSSLVLNLPVEEGFLLIKQEHPKEKQRNILRFSLQFGAIWVLTCRKDPSTSQY